MIRIQACILLYHFLNGFIGEYSNGQNPSNILLRQIASSTTSPSIPYKLHFPMFQPIDIILERTKLKEILERFHPISSAGVAAGFLTNPQFHNATIRIEMLVHLLFVFGKGERVPKNEEIKDLFNNQLGQSSLKQMEDPVEDVFVSNVVNQKGNFRIFEGVWQSNDFYLQRLLNVIQTLPDDEPSTQLKKIVQALLTLSEEIARRCGLARFTKSEGVIKSHKFPLKEELKKARQKLSFSVDDLNRLGISPSDLNPFVFPFEARHTLESQSLGHSDLEFRPIAKDGQKWVVLLPTAISISIRQHILYWMKGHGVRESLDAHLVTEYAEFLSDLPFFGRPIPKSLLLNSRRKIENQTLFEVTVEVDIGRPVQLIAVIHSTEDIPLENFDSIVPANENIGNDIRMCITSTRDYWDKKEDFKQGLTLIVSCGYGRSNAIEIIKSTDNWSVEMISAPDFETLSWLSDSSRLLILQIIGFSQHLQKNGILRLHDEGILNQLGWYESFNYLINVPFGREPIHLNLSADLTLKLRERHRLGWDFHALPYIERVYKRVRKRQGESYFKDDRNKRYYSIEEIERKEFLGVWPGERVTWWIRLDKEENRNLFEMKSRIWDALLNWMELISPVAERVFPDVPNVVLLVIDTKSLKQLDANTIAPEILSQYIFVRSNKMTRTITLSMSDPFLGGFQHPKNVAERLMIRRIIEGLVELTSNGPTINLDAVIQEIVKSDDARYIHAFPAVGFRRVASSLGGRYKILLKDPESAKAKLGLGWFAQHEPYSETFQTKNKSVSFLNTAVETVWNRMQLELLKWNRITLIEYALRAIEGADEEKTHWETTAKSVLALRSDQEAARDTAINIIGETNASKLSLRIIIEMAVCVCPLNGGNNPGELELRELMADAMVIFNLGGWSDAIQKGAMEPLIQVSPNGDILAQPKFLDEIADPHAKQFGTRHIQFATSRYDDIYELREPVADIRKVVSLDFLIAFESEFGVPMESFRSIFGSLQEFSLKKGTCVFLMHEAEIISLCQKQSGVTVRHVISFLKNFSLWSRERYDRKPEGFKNSDWYPWRFRRKLSLVMRPLIRIEANENSRYLISPGHIEESFQVILQRYLEAEVDPSECLSNEMKVWVNTEIDRRSHNFVQKVSRKLAECGYEIEIEKNMTEIIPENLERNFGDVDVLAWKKSSGEVLAIECKDLRFAKTMNEVAEQLSRFSGNVVAGDRDDLLKHLDRCSLLKAKKDRLAIFVDLPAVDIHVRGIVCFSRAVPMEFVSEKFPDIHFTSIDKLA